MLFDAVAVILSEEGSKALTMESAAIDFVRDAFGPSQGNGCRQRRTSAFKKQRMLGMMQALWMLTTQTRLLPRQRHDNGNVKRPYEPWRNRQFRRHFSVGQAHIEIKGGM